MIDFHNHLLAAVDDGASDLDQSEEAVRAMYDQGVRSIVVTPHLQGSLTERPEMLAQALATIDAAFDQFRTMADKAVPAVSVDRGAEIMLDSPSVVLTDPRVRLAGTNSVLVEFPGMMIPPHSVQALYQLRVRGWRPIVAHPERYHNLEGLHVVEEWRAVGASLQCNAGSIVGKYGSRAEEKAWDLLGRGYIDYLSSDYHARGRVPIAAARNAFSEGGATEAFDRLPNVNPQRLLDGTDPIPVGPVVRKRSLWKRILGLSNTLV